MSLRTNRDNLVSMAVQGKVAPAHQWAPFEVGSSGEIFSWPSTGGITYNVKIGDSVFGWMGDHIEPGVSVVSIFDDKKASAGFQFLSCCGNQARVISGEAKGAIGTVVGQHGGVEHLILDFPDDTLQQLTYDDKFLITAIGQGLKLTDHPDVFLYNLDPELFEMMGLLEVQGGKIEVPVSTIIPARAMGSGIGSLSITSGDYDIICHDIETVHEYNLSRLRFGDIVAVLDHDNRYGRTYRKGAVTIGVVVHSDSLLAGHGPGMTTLMSATDGKLIPVLDDRANIGLIRGIGRFVK